MEEKKVFCPGCGAPQVAMADVMKMSFKCPRCHTRWTVTFDTGEEGQRRAFINAEDIED